MATPAISHCPESGEGRQLVEKYEMGFAPAVRRAETPQRDGATHRMAKDASPVVFASRRVVRVPDFLDAKNRPQAIDMPVAVRTVPYVTCDPGMDSTGAKRTSDIYVISTSNRQHAEPAHLNPSFSR